MNRRESEKNKLFNLTFNGGKRMKRYYVYFFKKEQEVCHCFEDDKAQAEHFASLVNGRIHYGY